MQKPTTLKSLEKLMEKLFMEVKADFAKGMGGLSNDMRELKEELMIQKNRVVELEKSVKFISGGFDKLEKENKAMKSQIEVLKPDNVKLFIVIVIINFIECSECSSSDRLIGYN